MGGSEDFGFILKPLVDAKLISKIPDAPGWVDNGDPSYEPFGSDSNGSATDYFFIYDTITLINCGTGDYALAIVNSGDSQDLMNSINLASGSFLPNPDWIIKCISTP